ncbi:hypothetical protein ALO79_200026 [Pseudomonas syringae pv. castaneae]|uniref:Uncharacterized protein n=1 Tax=Pseudomonas syringae pv. castaneae TaxID=264450 RepID=A0A0P9S398_PSESX|nr:hypothetical protein ALO79_200026 [Pseudomonas syringae pv. castaneae]
MVAGLLLGAFGQEEVLARPHVRRAGHLEHALAQPLGAGDGATFHQVGHHRQVGAGLVGALLYRAHALADFQADVPQQGQETLDGVTKDLVIGVVQQDQQVDVGIRVQFATPIATHCHQGDVGIQAPVELLPGLLQDVVDEPGTVLDQPADIPAIAKALVEYFVGLADRLLEGRDGTCLQGQFSLELAAVEEFWIHLRHRMAFLSI